MKIIAWDQGTRFLVDVEADVDGAAQGFVIDSRREGHGKPMLIHSILARGYWWPADHLTTEQEQTLLATTRRITAPE